MSDRKYRSLLGIFLFIVSRIIHSLVPFVLWQHSKLTEPFNELVRVDRFCLGLFQWTLGSLHISQKGKNPTITIYNPFTESILNNICYGYHLSLNPVK